MVKRSLRGRPRVLGQALTAVLLIAAAVCVVVVAAPEDRPARAEDGPGATASGRIAFAGTGHVSLGAVAASELGDQARTTPFFGGGPSHLDSENTARGGQLVFTSRRDEPRPQVYLRAADGQVRRLTTGMDTSHPVLSPDGRTVAFASVEGNRHALWLVGSDGTGLRAATGDQAADEQWPSWSPDGSRLAFSSNREPLRGRQIYALAPGTGAVDRITDERAGDAIQPSWNPVHGDVLAYVCDNDRNDRTTEDQKAHIVKTDGSGDVLLVGGGHDDWQSRQPSWKPDGESVLFLSRYCLCGTPKFDQVYEQPTPGAAPSGPPKLLLAEDRQVSFPTWLTGPDRLVVTRLSAEDKVTADLRDVRPDGSDPRDLGVSVLREDPEASVDSRRIFRPGPGYDPWMERQSYSPDGRKLAFTRFEGPANARIERVWLADADGGNARPMPLEDRKPGDWEFDPVWSPDGGRIALSRRSPGGFPPVSGGTSRILVADPGTGRVVHRLDPPPGSEAKNDTQPAFSADGRTLAFTRGTIADDANGVEVRHGRIWTVDANSFTGQRDLSAVACGSDCDVVDDSAVFSPDGGSLVFNREFDGLLQVRTDGSDCRALLPAGASCAGPVGPTATAPFQPRDATFSPDGRQLVFSARNQGDPAVPERLLTADLTSGKLTPLTFSLPGRHKEATWQRSVDLRTALVSPPPQAVVGTPATLTLTVTDAGPAPSPGTTLNFAPPKGLRLTGAKTEQGSCLPAELRCDLGVVEPGKPVRVTVDVVGAAPGTRDLPWSVTGTVLDADPGNNSASARVSTVDAPPPGTSPPPPPPSTPPPPPPLPPPSPLASPNLQVSVTPEPSYVGGRAVATYLVRNTSVQQATGIRVSLVLPAGVPVAGIPAGCDGGQCYVGDLPAGGIAVLQVVFAPNVAVDTAVSGVLSSTGQDADYGDNTATAPMRVLQPKIVAVPPIGPPGFVTSVRGTDFPPGEPVGLNWTPGITAASAPAVPRPDGSFAAQLLILPKDQLGPRTITATGGGFSPVTTPFMVVAPSVGPPNFVERR
ncbi:DUF11 domain-containing protein [Amycolatopsis sp. CA-230715]|uniref:DUF11 domain-containing protein n=1 Tax=Amycolatopsis sp. CA-230715 TaxID=2745196 RepID=UPI001C00B17B|nr:DUF11 domain-containing protein [Amycolatopsis sp. CA-230715]